ncbi:CAP domain-containing protein [Massilia sp. FT127W]|uniref:CAP domain-containing protein n=1 Tax=Pseudoduganella aquatica TaxID=2660641 RepID=A0A7X4HIG2_9BURK|nr:CAP domain-containing protein [Pseudoduganella aquatica]
MVLAHAPENRSRLTLALHASVLLAALSAPPFAAAAAPGVPQPALLDLINGFRALPQRCGDLPASPMAPLAAAPALSRVRLGTGAFIELALERASYPVEHAAVIYVAGAPDAPAAMTVLREKYCHQLLNTQFSAVGAARDGDTWQVVLAEPQRPIPLPDPDLAGQAALAASNAARAAPRLCGDRMFAAAPPLSLNPALAEAALAHSSDMASKHYFSHQARDGSYAADRAQNAGYAWRIVGENIASGINTPEEAVAGWLESPGHCANIMNPAFTEMGAAYSLNTARRLMYWTQVLAAPR